MHCSPRYDPCGVSIFIFVSIFGFDIGHYMTNIACPRILDIGWTGKGIPDIVGQGSVFPTLGGRGVESPIVVGQGSVYPILMGYGRLFRMLAGQGSVFQILVG